MAQNIRLKPRQIAYTAPAERARKNVFETENTGYKRQKIALRQTLIVIFLEIITPVCSLTCPLDSISWFCSIGFVE